MRRLSARTAAVAVALLALAPVAARADDSRTVTVVGTSDVADSGLVAHVLEPGFERAFPQYDLQYVSKGTGAAIAFAEAGTASGLIVHAASLENQFVASGFSNERFGRAIFFGDYVLLGSKNDPAGVLTNAPHDIVTAFERIAHTPNITFVSRGGTPGTTVAEHGIWALTSGVTLCDVSAANGGGKAPSTATGPCPSTPSNPPWYQTTGLTQGPNIQAADACNFAGQNAACYVLTDRGTFNFLQSEGTAQNLKIVTRDNDPSKRGGGNLLVNSFHGYVLNPAKFSGQPNVHINVAGATAFLNWVTSAAGQAAVHHYLSGGGDPPFLPSASPALTGSGVPATVTAGTPVTISGSLRNVVPGTPALGGEPVSIATPGGTVATGTTDGAGNYSITFTPVANASYAVTTGVIAKIENPALNPVFGDLLTPASTPLGSATVQSTISVSRIATRYRRVTVSGAVAPSVHAHGAVTVIGRRGGSGAFKNLATASISGGTFSVPARLRPGRWQIEARFDDPGQVLGAISSARTVRVPGASSVKLSRLTVSGGAAVVRGSVRPTPSSKGAYVRLLGRHNHGAFKPVSKKVKLAKGHRRFTIRTHLRRGLRWQVRVLYVHKGRIDSSKSRTRTVRVR